MSRFDEEPDGDPHGECALEITRLQSERDQYYKCFLAEQTEHAKAIADRDDKWRELIASAERVKVLEAALRDITARSNGASYLMGESIAQIARQALGGENE